MSFRDIDKFWSYIHETKTRYVRTIFFEVNAHGSISILETCVRGATSSDDISRIFQYMMKSDQPVWFLVRCDFSDQTDSQFKLGFSGISSPTSNRFVYLLASSYVGYLECEYYGTKHDLEDRIWDHLFPYETREKIDSPGAISAVVVEGSSPPSFRLLPSANVHDLCRNKQTAYILIPGIDSVARVHLFHPEGVCPRCRVRRDDIADKSPTILAFMKPDLIPWLTASICERYEFTFGIDVESCADLPSLTHSAPVIDRRRSNDIVLSPPTLQKYKGPSKRSRNFPDHVSLVDN